MAKATALNPLYNRSAHLFRNCEEGPRELDKKERDTIALLESEIQALEDGGASLKRSLFRGFSVSSPLGVASGPAYGSKFLGLYTRLGYGFVTQKTVRDRIWEGNPVPNVLYLKGGDFESGFVTSDAPTLMMTNSFGMTSIDPGEWERDLASFSRTHEEPLIISGVATKAATRSENIEQYVKLGVVSERIGANAYEINVSCPNEMEGHSGELQDDLGFLSEVLLELKDTLTIPILIKIGHREDLSRLVLSVGKILDGIGGFVAINTKPAVVRKDDGSYAYGEGRPRAGINMKPLAPFAKDALRQLVRIRKQSGYDFRIFNVGGILTPEDVAERLEMGADAVESAGAAMTDPYLGLETKKYLLEKASGR
jgi:dihydroorotate dehydrogenase